MKRTLALVSLLTLSSAAYALDDNVIRITQDKSSVKIIDATFTENNVFKVVGDKAYGRKIINGKLISFIYDIKTGETSIFKNDIYQDYLQQDAVNEKGVFAFSGIINNSIEIDVILWDGNNTIVYDDVYYDALEQLYSLYPDYTVHIAEINIRDVNDKNDVSGHFKVFVDGGPDLGECQLTIGGIVSHNEELTIVAPDDVLGEGYAAYNIGAIDNNGVGYGFKNTYDGSNLFNTKTGNISPEPIYSNAYNDFFSTYKEQKTASFAGEGYLYDKNNTPYKITVSNPSPMEGCQISEPVLTEGKYITNWGGCVVNLKTKKFTNYSDIISEYLDEN